MTQTETTRPASGIEAPIATLRSLVRARWAVIACVATLASIVTATSWSSQPGLAAAGLPTSHHVPAFVAVLVGWAGLNGWTAARLGRATETPLRFGRQLAGIHLVTDVAALTGLLAASGAASNPFTALYFVPITLATQISPRWAWAVGGSAVLGFGVLLLLGPSVPPGPHAHHFAGHLRGMWIALGVSGSVLTYFVHRIAVTRAAERAELARLRREALEDRHLTALGTLAAGAAHELATPLATVQVLAGELDHMDTGERGEAVLAMRVEIGRCKEILGRMASPQLRVEAFAPEIEGWPLAELASGLEALGGGEVEVDASKLAACVGVLRQPRRATQQILTELVHNAVQASSRAATVGKVRVFVRDHADPGNITIVVSDHAGGIGGHDEARVLEPFFTTRPEGEGMGLGLYLVRAHVRQLGGAFALDNRPGVGLEATVSLPGYVPGKS